MKYAILDLETTGHSALDEIIQIGLVVVSDDLEIIDTYSTFVKPTVEIPAFITGLTGIQFSDVQDAPDLNDALVGLIPHLDDAVLVAHNVGFDANFLNHALDQCGYLPFNGRRLDTMDFLRILYPSITSYQLGTVAEQLGVEHEMQHRADSDALATAHIFIDCVSKLRSMPLLTLQRLSSFFDESRDLGWYLSYTEKLIEQQSVFDSAEYDYYRQFALKATPWADETSAREKENANEYFERVTSFEQYIEDVQNRFKEMFENYEERKPQIQMYQEVYEALNDDKHLLIEAGTGTGKSLGYLIPALYYGIQTEEKVIVSTHTINLQEQLRNRDIPLLNEILPFPFRASLLKGRGNYLCMRKFEHKLNTKDFVAPVDDPVTAAQMVIWLSETETGDQEELNLGLRGADFWGTVSSDADSCLNRACPWFKRCYYHRAKHESNISDVCITNHSMIFTDIQADHRLLPGYTNLILDEAHHLEEVAGKHLGNQMTYTSYIYAMNMLFKDMRTGVLPSLRIRVQEDNDDHTAAWNEVIDSTYPQLQDIKEHWDKLFEWLYSIVSTDSTQSNEVGSEGTASMVFRLDRHKLPSEWNEAMEVENNFHVQLSRLVKSLEKLSTDVKERLEEDTGLQSILIDLNGILRDLNRIKDELRMFMKLEQEDYVYWMEGTQAYKFRSLQLFSAPVDVSGLLKKYLFEVKDTVVMTSATLSIQKNFEYVEEQLGLSAYENSNRVKAVMLDSPFNYREQALVIIPRDFPVLKGANIDSAYLDKLVGSLTESAQTLGGKMLVLFTSYRLLKQVYDPLKSALQSSNIQVLGQGIDSNNRTKLTRRFLQNQASVLLGTSSFWEGVDIPGESLQCLAIVRLPFQPPNHPLVEAKSELLQRQKKNPFMKLSIPQAVIRFKQGFGRLVRTATDKGIVIIYDTRVIEAYYGKHFLYSLPGPKIETMHTSQMPGRMEEWLKEE
ncbi:MAG: ATP-dependent DNA helicase DinG [Candidatus Pristimantibacillus lignocellulolyticus]|uniref:3'-5' exonuclease DinG n=1 Tax=Candidatus Pristimantibacillus lignocellulolyticus TaxID=2994561 RepID=A0A9J6ZDI2_9BACL|nr:MAG: ATP-dependent DNA helicase DinG [Candidatus Pristimantibacillus lignocellulolyticus]